jgi:uncharacterized protein
MQLTPPKPLSVLIKPASGCCNLRCSYCFYREYPQTVPKMAPETVKALVKKAFSYATGPVSFAFQGGEPTLCGAEFFRHFFETVDACNIRRLPVFYALQTNGLLMDDDFAALLASRKALIGLSLDGPEDLHNKHRVDPKGQNSANRVLKAAQALRRQGASFNILSVVTSTLCQTPDETYAFMKEHGFSYLQFIPCLPPYGKTPAQFPYSPSPRELGRFLTRVAELWHADWKNGTYVSIRYFDNLVGMLLGRPTELCTLRGVCANQLVLEADGSCYPCDFYVTPSLRLGNIISDDFETLLKHHKAVRFTTPQALAKECLACPYVSLCKGGCKRERDKTGKTFFCEGYRSFFKAALPLMTDIAQDIVEGKTPPPPKE